MGVKWQEAYCSFAETLYNSCQTLVTVYQAVSCRCKITKLFYSATQSAGSNLQYQNKRHGDMLMCVAGRLMVEV